MVILAVMLAGCRKSDPADARPIPSATVEHGARLLAPGDDAPKIDATAHTGENVNLGNFKGKPVVVYFYPKDDTPGCTVEAQGFRDEHGEIAKTGAVVIGVSTDDNVSHRAFATKYELPFLLLPDTNREITKAFGVPIVKGHAKRVTFVIDRAGKIAKVFPEVTPRDHAKEVIAAITALPG